MQNYEFNFECNLHDDVDGHTFVVSVDVELVIGEHTKTANFQVNCQFDDDDTYKVSCHNDSGGCYRDSGLAAWIAGHGITDFDKRSLIAEINACAQSQANLQRMTVEEYLEEQTGTEWVIKDHSVLGCFYPTNVSHRLYECGNSLLYVCEDTDEIRPENIVLGFKEFESEADFINWMDALDSNWGNRHADFGMAKLAFDAVCWED